MALTRLSLGGALPGELMCCCALQIAGLMAGIHVCLWLSRKWCCQTDCPVAAAADPVLVASLPQLKEVGLVNTRTTAKLGYEASLRALRSQLAIQPCVAWFG
jgi:hypothetical protein